MSGTTGYRVDPGTGFGAGIALVKTGGLLSGYDIMNDQISIKEYTDPFTGEPVK